MSRQSKRTSLALLCLLVTILLAGPISPAQAQSEVFISEPQTTSHFPEGLTLQASASCPDQQIVGAEIAYSRSTFYSPESYTIEQVEITPGSQVNLEYQLDTENLTTPPMMSFRFRWELQLADGTDFISETYTVPYLDERYDWQVLENEGIAVWWHDKPAEFGQAVFEISAEAIRQQSALFQTNLEQQIQVVINNDQNEFASWHNITHDWVGGETFTDYGITVQIVPSSNPADDWLYGVIPHEISHLFFGQATHNPTTSIPVWLNEGVSQYNEMVSQEGSYRQVRSAAEAGDLITLHALANGFGSYNTSRVYLAYAESVSAVNYLVETYGTDGLGALLKAYREGYQTEEAFQQALGISATQFELDWAASLEAVDYQIATPPPLPTFPPSPTPGSAGFSGSTPAPTLEKPLEKNPVPFCSSILGLLGFGMIAVWQKKSTTNRPG